MGGTGGGAGGNRLLIYLLAIIKLKDESNHLLL